MNNQVILIWNNFYHRNGVLGTNNLKLHQCSSPKVPAPWPGCPISLDNSEQDNTTSCDSSYHRWRCTSQDLRPFTGSFSIGLLIIIIDQYLTRRRPDMQIYLIKQIAFSHPTSNNMVCDCTFMCPRTLFSSPIGSWLWCPQCQEAATLSLFQLQWVYKQAYSGHIISLASAAASTTPPLQDLTSPSPLLLLLDVPCQDLKSLFLCYLAHARKEGRSLFHRKSHHLLKNVLANAIDFPSQVTSLLTLSYSGRLATVARFSLRGAVILLLRAWYCYQVPCILLDRTPTVGWLCFLHGAVSAQILPTGATRPVGQDALVGWVIYSFESFVAQVPTQFS